VGYSYVLRADTIVNLGVQKGQPKGLKLITAPKKSDSTIEVLSCKTSGLFRPNCFLVLFVF
jgi:hypothetical protein